MKRAFFLVWLLIPLAAFAWHRGPGQAQASRDEAGTLIRAAEAAESNDDWKRADELYGRALDQLARERQSKENDKPSTEKGAGSQNSAAEQRIQLAQARARIFAGDMVEGQEQLQSLLEEMEKTPRVDPELIAGTRHELASAGYYAAWVMRLEGAAPDEWLPETERARQQFRLLAEQADGTKAEDFQKNLEATILLEQMDLSTLKARPLPKQCNNCKNLSQRKRQQCLSRCKSPGDGKKKPEDEELRKEIKKSNKAGLNERQGTGS